MEFCKENLFSIVLIGVTLTAAAGVIVTVSVVSTSNISTTTEQWTSDDDGSGESEMFDPTLGVATMVTDDDIKIHDLYSEQLIPVYEKKTI